jgi:hypothetical protein
MLTGAHKTQRTASLFFDILERYHKDGDEFLNHIARATGDETWVSFVKPETKKHSGGKALDAHTFTKQAEKL